jgi:hypothetical protein
MAMIFPVGPGCFWTAQTLAICTDKPGSTICVTDHDKITKDSLTCLRRRSSPLNLDKWHVVK